MMIYMLYTFLALRQISSMCKARMCFIICMYINRFKSYCAVYIHNYFVRFLYIFFVCCCLVAQRDVCFKCILQYIYTKYIKLTESMFLFYIDFE